MYWPSGSSPNLDVRDWIASFLYVGHLRRCVFGRGVHHGYGDNRGQPAGNSASEEQVEAWLIARFHAVRSDVQVGRLMPRIDRGAIGKRLLLIGGVVEQIGECPAVIDHP